MMQRARSQWGRRDRADDKEGRLGSSGSPPEHTSCPGAAGYGGEACHIALQLQIPAAHPTTTSTAFLANPSLQGNASQTYSQAGKKPRPIAQWEGASCSVSRPPWIAEGSLLLPYPEKALLLILGF